MPLLSRLLPLWVTLVILLPASAMAQTEHDAEGRAAFESGQSAYRAGEFDAALAHFQRAYELSERPALLFNIGQCHDRLRRDREAITALESYLERVPDSANRDTVAARIEILRARIAEDDARDQEAAAAEERALRAEHERNIALSTTTTPEAPEDEGSVFGEWWFWTVVGVVIVGATVAIVAAATYDPGVASPVPGDSGSVVTALEW